MAIQTKLSSNTYFWLLAFVVAAICLGATPSATAAPDLIAYNISVSDTTVDPGQSITVYWTAKNQGSSIAYSTQQGVMWSTNSIISRSDALLEKEYLGWMSSGETSPESHTITIPSNATPGSKYYIGIIADYDYDEAESNESNNDDGVPASVTINVPPKPDLIAYGISVSDTTVTPGQSVTVYWTAKNQGTASCGSSQQGVMWSTDSTISRSDTLLEREYLGGLSPGESTQEQHTIRIPTNAVPGGSYYIGVYEDYDLTISESDETNNASPGVRVTINIPPKPDLIAYSISVSDNTVTRGQGVTVSWTAKNQGDGSCGSTQQGVMWSTDSTINRSDRLLEKEYLGGLNPGQTSSESHGITIPSDAMPGRTYYIGIIADYDDDEDESNESNNDDGTPVAVIIIAPDLIAYGISVSDTTVDPAQNVTVYWAAENQGNASCGSTQQGIMWSTNSIISRSDTWLENEYLGGLSPGQTTPEAHMITIPNDAIPGNTYYIGIIADYDYDEDESNESNNDDGTPAAVTINIPDLIAYGTGVDDNTVTRGQSVTVTWTAKNQGNGNCGSSQQGVLWSTDSNISKSDPLLEKEFLGPMDPGDTTAEVHTVTVPMNATYGATYYIGVYEDYDEIITESNNNNNASQGVPVTIIDDRPDLTGYNLSASDDTVDPGQNITLYWTVKNQGLSTSGACRQGIMWSTDSIITRSDTLLEEEFLGPLNPSETTPEAHTITIPGDATSGNTYYIGIILDFGYDIDESNENNNVVGPIPIYVNPRSADLGVTAFSMAWELGDPRAQNPVSGSYTIANYGPFNVSDDSYRIDFYLSNDLTITAGDIKIGDNGITITISSGQTKNYNMTPTGLSFVTIPMDMPPGTYYVGMHLVPTGNSPVDPLDDNNWWTDGTVTIPEDPDIRIEPTILEFEASATGAAAATSDVYEYAYYDGFLDSAEEDANAVASPYYYYYFDTKIPLILDVNQIAIEQRFEAGKAKTEGQFAQYGVLDADVRSLPIAGWSLARTPDFLASAEGTEQLVDQMTSDEVADFISPVFVGRDGGQVIITSTIFVGFNENVSADQAEAILSELGVDAVIEPNYASMKGVYRLSDVGRNGFEILQKANSLAELPKVKFAEPDIIFTGSGALLPNDPDFANCWGLHNTGQSGGTSDMDMDAPEAWDLTTGDPSIIVVIIDTGVQQNHPDIHQIAGADFTGQGGGGGPLNACDNHGTAVAGCVSAVINNNLGTVGIAPDCVVASARVFISNTNPCGSWTTILSWTVDALDWAENIGARVTNNSNSYGNTSSLIDTKYADTRDNGIIHFASAGNDALGTINYPASLPTVNAIAALDHDGDLATFSNHGSGLAFSAPGESIYTTDRTGSDGYSIGDYGTRNGTSFASPYAAGVAALVLSVNDSLDAQGVEQILQSSSIDLPPAGYDTTFGWGFVNAFEAINQASNAQSFTIYNDGAGTLTVNDITKENSSCWLTFSPEPPPPFDVLAGDSQLVTVTVLVNCVEPGDYYDRLLVYSNDPDEPVVDEVEVILKVLPCLATVPDVLNMTESAAETALIAAGLVKGSVTSQCSDIVPAGEVISQDPIAWESDDCGSAVNLVISNGQCTIDLNLTLDYPWMYQNLPGQNGCGLTACVSISDDPLGNSSYSYEWEFILPTDVSIAPTTIAGGGSVDECWTFAAPGCDQPEGLSDSGQLFKVKVTVSGDQYNNTGTAEAEFNIALLGDVDNNAIVEIDDRSIVNLFWRGYPVPYSFRDCDVNCDGMIDVDDRSIVNLIMRGYLCQNSVGASCPLR